MMRRILVTWVLGNALRKTPEFRGKSLLRSKWYGMRKVGRLRHRLGCGSEVLLNANLNYEASIWLGIEEKRELQFISRILRHGDTFVDVGANIGLWSLTAAVLVGRCGHVIAFEPNPMSYARLMHHVQLNAADCISAYNMGLGDWNGIAVISMPPAHNLSRILDKGSARESAGSTRAKIQISTLDTMLDGPIVGMKIDVEGHEEAVLRGARDTIVSCRPWIVIEFNTDYAGSNTLREWSVHGLLRSLGYCGNPISFCRSRGLAYLREDDVVTGYENLFYFHPDHRGGGGIP